MKMGRRRSSILEGDLHRIQALSTCEESPTQDRKISDGSSIAETVIAIENVIQISSQG